MAKPKSCLSIVATLMIFSACVICLLQHRILTRQRIQNSLFPTRESLTVLTLIYGQPSQHRNIEHNCAMISHTRHRYIIFTDSMSQQYCSRCTCISFTKSNCPCPDDSKSCGEANQCEKLLFFIRAIEQFHEFVLLDNDLLILKDYFLDHLSNRALVHDFLATYGHKFMGSLSYWRHFNSGLLFIRRLPGVKYHQMEKTLYERRKLSDQGVISMFIQQNYRNWDVLSWKWHCRMLSRMSQDIPLSDCYTIHDRDEVEDVLRHLNLSRLTIP